MDVLNKVKSIKGLVKKIKSDLPMFGSADITVRIETAKEVQDVAKNLGLIYHIPKASINVHWCVYREGPIQITIQTFETEQAIEEKHNNINNN